MSYGSNLERVLAAKVTRPQPPAAPRPPAPAELEELRGALRLMTLDRDSWRVLAELANERASRAKCPTHEQLLQTHDYVHEEGYDRD